jgi:membrane fusion protein (multidrug efflux system)
VSGAFYENGLSWGRALVRWLALCNLCVVVACAAVDAEPVREAAKTVEVTVEAIRVESIALQTELAGRTSPFRVAEVRPQVTGIIQARDFREGSQVEAGQL